MQNYKLETGRYSRIEFIAKKTEEPCGFIRLHLGNELVGEYYFKFKGYESYAFDLQKQTEYFVEISGLEFSLCYLCGQENILEEGVKFLTFKENEIIFSGEDGPEKEYEQEFRNRFHFSPYKNWMNDPNGLCFFQGYYHLFYQYNPNGLQWGNMHWGHAVSKDLVHWRHLPVALYPQIELLDAEEFRGGAFSGSAVIRENRMHLFFTRHFGKTDRSWQRQWQMTCISEDGVHFSQETVAVWGTPEGVYYDFRDPKVIEENGVFHMILGGTVHHVPAILDYISEDLDVWNYNGVIFEEKDPAYGISECPDIYPLGGKYVLTAGYIYAHPEQKKSRQDTKYYIGTWENGRFKAEAEGIYDYGRDFYAVQSFEHNGRRISIGWNNGVNEMPGEGSSNGTASIPREMRLENGRLLMTPAEEMRLLEEKPADVRGKVKGLKGYRLEAELPENFKGIFYLAQNECQKVTLTIDGNVIKLITGKEEDACVFHGESYIKDLDVFVDRSLIEIFVNKGAHTCTRRYYLAGQEDGISFDFESDKKVKSLTVKPMKGIFGREKYL